MRKPCRRFAPQHLDKHDLHQARKDGIVPWPDIEAFFAKESDESAKPRSDIVRSLHMNEAGKEIEKKICVCRFANDYAGQNPGGSPLRGIADPKFALHPVPAPESLI
jgi:hypothetical protein